MRWMFCHAPSLLSAEALGKRVCVQLLGSVLVIEEFRSLPRCPPLVAKTLEVPATAGAHHITSYDMSSPMFRIQRKATSTRNPKDATLSLGTRRCRSGASIV